MNGKIILTNHDGADRSRTWEQGTFRPQLKKITSIKAIDNLYKAFQLFLLRKHFEVVVLGGGAQVDLWYLFFQRLWPFHVKPVVKIDCLWYQSGPLKHLAKKLLFKWLDRVVDLYVVWCQREIEDYSKAFGLPKGKFVFVPYHTTIDSRHELINSGYVFSGGNFARDYRTLAKAVRGLDLTLIIACTNAKALEGIDFPVNVSVVGVSEHEFRELMAGSWINVVALDSSLLHSGGQQTFLNAMAMGKPVIVTDPEAGRGYIDHGIDGLLVPGGDALQLRHALLSLIDNPGYAASLGARARKKALQMDTEKHLTTIAELARRFSVSSGATCC